MMVSENKFRKVFNFFLQNSMDIYGGYNKYTLFFAVLISLDCPFILSKIDVKK